MHSPDTIHDFQPGAPPLAVILAAGEGSRLSCQSNGTTKPALSLLGLSLAERTISSCIAAGIERFLVVLGYYADQVRAHYREIAARWRCGIEFVTAQDWKLGNGVSVLAIADKVGSAPFLLTMYDHLIAPSLIEKILRTRPRDGEICLAVDRHKAGIFDVEDVTKVELSDDHVVRIGKTLKEWCAADTGVFFCTRALFDALKRVRARKKYSLSDGVSELAAAGQVNAVDVTGEDWIDVDTPETFREACRCLLANLRKGGEEGYVSVRLNRPVSTRVSARLVSTGITPNQITVISFLISLLGAGLLSVGQYAVGLVGGLLVQLASVIDGCDGEGFRLKHLSSARGAWLDTILDRYADLAVALAVTYVFAAAHPGPLPWIAGFLVAFGFILASYVTKEFAIRHGRPYANDVLNRLKRRDLRILLICLGALVGRPFEALVFAGALSHVCVIGVLIKGWVRIDDCGFRIADFCTHSAPGTADTAVVLTQP
ncbi:MAG TPA: NTP transferase domain-containing protein [Phycisphaerae bacterium]|nr:NTP transferase domain-containing protein [Phycisphaerae bacterium]